MSLFSICPQAYYLYCLFTLIHDKEQFTKEVHLKKKNQLTKQTTNATSTVNMCPSTIITNVHWIKKKHVHVQCCTSSRLQTHDISMTEITAMVSNYTVYG